MRELNEIDIVGVIALSTSINHIVHKRRARNEAKVHIVAAQNDLFVLVA